MMIIQLKGDCALRPVSFDDTESLFKYGSDPAVCANMPDSFAFGLGYEHALNWIAEAMMLIPVQKFAITQNDVAIGTISLKLREGDQAHVAELGYWIGKTHWGKGLGTHAVNAAVRYGFEQLELARIFAYVFSSNAGSCRVLEKTGFKREAVLRNDIRKETFLDQFIYGLLKHEFMA